LSRQSTQKPGKMLTLRDEVGILELFLKTQNERRVVKIPQNEDDLWILSNEIQIHWEIIGNIFENPDLLKNEQ